MSKMKPIVLGISLALMSGAVLASSDEKNPYEMEDNTWISLSGSVESVTPDTFTLDYGEGIVTVEMDDGDRDADAYKLMVGDKVTVNGFVDDDDNEIFSIEAGSVYVEKLDTYFFASAVDEEDKLIWYTVPVVVGDYVVQGTVTEVSGDEFNLMHGGQTMTVDVDSMPYNPLDDQGYQKIEPGDYVRVSGNLEDNIFLGEELEAHKIVTLINN